MKRSLMQLLWTGIFLGLSTLTSPAVHATIVTHYTFNSTFQSAGNTYVTDGSSFGNHGQVFGAPVLVPGEFDNALQFNNPMGGQEATQWVALPNSASVLGLQNSSFTLAVKYRTTNALVPGNGRLLGNASGSPGMGYNYNSGFTENAHGGVRGTSGAVADFFPDVLGNPAAYTTDGLPHWGILVVNRTLLTVDFYRDNVLIGSRSGLNFGNIPFANLTLGKNSAEPKFAFIGDLDEFQLHDRAFTAAEVAALVNNVPEPGSMWCLFGLGICWFTAVRVRRAKQVAMEP